MNSMAESLGRAVPSLSSQGKCFRVNLLPFLGLALLFRCSFVEELPYESSCEPSLLEACPEGPLKAALSKRGTRTSPWSLSLCPSVRLGQHTLKQRHQSWRSPKL